MNKATRTKIQKYTLAKLTELFGPIRGDGTWIIPFGSTGGTVSIRPIFDGTPWLACRLSNPRHLDERGYVLPRSVVSDWPRYFTYPSGKNNLHSGPKDTFEDWERDFAHHLQTITAPGSAERQLVGDVTWVNS